MCLLVKLSATMFLAALLTAGAPAPTTTASSGQVPAPGSPNQQKFESISGQITAISGKTFTLAPVPRSSLDRNPSRSAAPLRTP